MKQEIVSGALCQARLEYTLFPSTTKLEQSFEKRRWVAEERRKDEDPHRISVVREWIIKREILRSKEKNLFSCERVILKRPKQTEEKMGQPVLLACN